MIYGVEESTPPPAEYDVAIAGAGPAGALTAYRLAAKGWRVVLLERERLPRYKVCGGGVTAKALAEIPFDVSSTIERATTRARISFRQDTGLDLDTPAGAAVCVMRDRFDAALVDTAVAAGAELRQGVKVEGVVGDNLWTSDGIIVARVIVGADGAPSRVARTAGMRQGKRQTPAIEAEVAVDAATLERWANTVLFDFFAAPGGYGWIFPKGDHLSIGLCSLRGKVDGLKEAARTYVTTLIGPDWTLRGLKGHLLPVGGPDGEVAKGNVLLVGDAAGLVDPFTGEGIYAAVRSAHLAADAIDAHLAGRLASLTPYSTALTHEFGREYRRADQVGSLVYRHPRLSRHILRNRAIAQGYVSVITGTQTYRAFIRSAATNPIRTLAGFFG